MIITSGRLPARLPCLNLLASALFDGCWPRSERFSRTSGAFSLSLSLSLSLSRSIYFSLFLSFLCISFSILGRWEWRLSFSTWCPIDRIIRTGRIRTEMSPIVLNYLLEKINSEVTWASVSVSASVLEFHYPLLPPSRSRVLIFCFCFVFLIIIIILLVLLFVLIWFFH